MLNSKEFSKKVYSNLYIGLETLRFEKKKPKILTTSLTPDVLFWVGFNTAIKQGGTLEINAVVGVRNQVVERQLSELLEEPFNELTPPTLVGNIGYQMPVNRYTPYLFTTVEDITTVCGQLCNDIKTYGLPFAKRITDLVSLLDAMQSARFCIPEQIDYRIPVTQLLLCMFKEASVFIQKKLDKMGSRIDPAACRYKLFAKKVMEEVNRGGNRGDYHNLTLDKQD